MPQVSDVAARARAALEGVTAGPWQWDWHVNPIDDDELHGPNWEHVVGTRAAPSDADAEFIAAARTLVPELVAEVERLRAAGPWVEHLEHERAMKRERDGECICDRGPESDGPDEFCPWHGRPYPELVTILEQLAQERAFRSVPAEPVDFYSLEDVCRVRAEYETEIAGLRGRAGQLRAFARDCVEHGDMTPAGARMLNKIADAWDEVR